MVKNALVWISGCFLCACTTDPVPDEEFESPTTHFPLLGQVPDRPLLPEQDTLVHQQKHLQSERDEAVRQESEIVKLTKR